MCSQSAARCSQAGVGVGISAAALPTKPPPGCCAARLCVCLQGQFDAQDGVAGTNAWIKRLRWHHTDEFERQEGQLWYVQPSDGATAAAAGWRRSVSTLTQVVVRNAGHMVPRDQPQAALVMMQAWVESVLASEEGVQQQAAAEL